VSGLLGVSRDQVMPLVPEATRLTLAATDAGFLVLGVARATLRVLFLLGILLGLMRLLVICVLAIWQRFHPHRPADAADLGALELPPCAVIIPAYNEARVIVRTIESILASTRPPREIIVVDDGSADETYETVTTAFGADPRVRAFRKSNAGKAAALNFGLAHTDAAVVVALDADTIFEPDAIEHLTAHFVDPTIGAVAGNAKVGNRINTLTRWQALEYITSQNLDRRAFDRLNCMTVVPGAVGAWRRELVQQAGGFSADTLAEDADLTLAMLRRGTRVIYDDRAVAWTEAPDSVSGLLKQRFRWVFGTLQAAWKQRDALGRPRFGTLGTVALPNLIIFGVIFPVISPLMDLQMLFSLIGALVESRQHPLEFSADVFSQTLFYYALFVFVDLLAAALAFLLERREQWRLILSMPIQRFTYRQLMYVVSIRALLAALRGHLVGWGKLERKATVTS
jgi:cellulose synthase/poly-beta-1,6-N-acetylglucosamine synthase-like glycosyltransferase